MAYKRNGTKWPRNARAILAADMAGFWPDGPYALGVVWGQASDFNYIAGGSVLLTLVQQARSDHL